jgi:hypothetical protein
MSETSTTEPIPPTRWHGETAANRKTTPLPGASVQSDRGVREADDPATSVDGLAEMCFIVRSLESGCRPHRSRRDRGEAGEARSTGSKEQGACNKIAQGQPKKGESTRQHKHREARSK